MPQADGGHQARPHKDRDTLADLDAGASERGGSAPMQYLILASAMQLSHHRAILRRLFVNEYG